ncbi:MAG: peptidase M3, partial [Treponema sp.]|nr:peptidase M3 [Treponema sp.]
NALNVTIDLHNGLRASERRLALVLASHQKYMDDFYTRNPAYRDYRYLLQELADSSAHQMSAAEEKRASDMQKTGGEAGSRLQEQIISTLQDEKGRIFNELRGLASSADKDERKEAYEKELELLRTNRVALAACLNNLKGETVMLNARRNWKGALDRALSSSRLSRESLDALIGAIEDSLPV